MRRFTYISLLFLVFVPLHAVAEGWSYRVAVTISNLGGAFADYTIRVPFGAAQRAIFDSSLANGDDWRFRASDGVTVLPHWFQLWQENPDTAIALVRMDTLRAGLNTIYLYFGNPSASNTSNGAAVCPLFLDFPTDWTVSGVADILNMQGTGVDTVRGIAIDTNSADSIMHVTGEPGNIFINPLAPNSSMRYLFWYCTRRNVAYSRSDSQWMYQAKSSDGLAWISMGRVDTLGGNASCDSARGQDPYMIEFADSLWSFHEYKNNFHPACSDSPKCDRVGLWSSGDGGIRWAPEGIVINRSGSGNLIISPSSPAAIVVGEYIYLAVESKGDPVPGAGDCGGGFPVVYRATHPRGPWELWKAFPCDLAPNGYDFVSAVPGQIFEVDGEYYLDCHASFESVSGWRHTRWRFGANFDTLLDERVFSNDSMLAGAIIVYDTLRDSTWITLTIEPGGNSLVRWRAMKADATAAPAGWTPYWSTIPVPNHVSRSETKFGFLEARNGVMTLACEPWRSSDGSMALGFRSEAGFDSNFVIEAKMRLKWDVGGPLAVLSFGSGDPAPISNFYTLAYQTGTDSGLMVVYASGSNACRLTRKPVGASAQTGTTFTVPDSLLRSWRVNHLAYSGDTLRWWLDGSAATLRPKAAYPVYRYNSKRILLAAGEGENRTRRPLGSQWFVEWLLVRRYQHPEPTVTFGDVQAIPPQLASPPQPTVVVQEEDGYLRLHWTNTGAPLYHVLCSTALDGPYSLLLSTGDTTATVARTDTAEVKRFYQVTSVSE